MFLQLIQPVREEWESGLRAEHSVDFDDMLLQAAELIEAGQWTSPYRLITVDEMQDTSAARARLIAGLLKMPDRYLFAVGDDWQSINRFAGSDLSVMADFDSWFGPAETVKLETTFRCPQSLCDIAGGFVTKNPDQLSKAVRSNQADGRRRVRAISLKKADDCLPAIMRHLEGLDEQSAQGTRQS